METAFGIIAIITAIIFYSFIGEMSILQTAILFALICIGVWLLSAMYMSVGMGAFIGLAALWVVLKLYELMFTNTNDPGKSFLRRSKSPNNLSDFATLEVQPENWQCEKCEGPLTVEYIRINEKNFDGYEARTIKCNKCKSSFSYNIDYSPEQYYERIFQENSIFSQARDKFNNISKKLTNIWRQYKK